MHGVSSSILHTILHSVTDCVAVPESRSLIYDSVTVNYGAQKRCYGRLKRCYGGTYREVLVRRAGGHPVNTLVLAILPAGLHGIQIRPFCMPRMFATHEAIAMNASLATILN
jgi:hypothetical protein